MRQIVGVLRFEKKYKKKEYVHVYFIYIEISEYSFGKLCFIEQKEYWISFQNLNFHQKDTQTMKACFLGKFEVNLCFAKMTTFDFFILIF